LKEVFDRLDRRCKTLSYGEQQVGLQQEYGEAAFVASVVAFVREGNNDEAFETYATWSKTVVTLLPQSDYVILVDVDSREKLRVAWADVAAIVGDLLQPIGVYPERYRVETFPSAAQLVRLRQAAENQNA
jgi:hypothetical protein